jgi:ATP-dependent RNA helicase DeaD
MNGFVELGITKELVEGLSELGIHKPTEIQTTVIPLLLGKNTDLVGQAQTGTGKTAAFGLPLLQKVNPKLKETQALILVPTRELGQQVQKQLFRFTKYSDKIFAEAVYGGEKIEKQISRLSRTTHIVVATPGRLLDLVRRKIVDLRNVKHVVLDEADEMLSMGFKSDLDAILTGIKNVKSTWLFSATIPFEIEKIIKKHLSETAIRIVIDASNIVNEKIEHQYLLGGEAEKLNNLVAFLKSRGAERGLIFCKTKAVTQKLAKQLISKKFATDAIHGDLHQKDRDKVMRAFKNEKLQMIVATDLAARGLDIQGLSYVAHYTLPDKEDFYTHSSGRTARGGKSGLSISFVTPREIKHLKNFQASLGIELIPLGEE